MPELPEVEVTRRGIAPHIAGQPISDVTIRNGSLRWPVAPDLPAILGGTLIKTVTRRGKFILLQCVGPSTRGTLLIHLGMTGTLRIVDLDTALRTHDHVDLLVGAVVLRFNDPRRFGAILWHDETASPLETNRHLSALGVEPLSERFAGDAGTQVLFAGSRRKATSIKQLLLAGQVVVGVGNIYASEALFRARIRPTVAAGRIGVMRYRRLAQAVRDVLAQAIDKGGSTLRDYSDVNGNSGYFQNEYFVYARQGEPCKVCGAPIKAIRQGQRATFYCGNCQRA